MAYGIVDDIIINVPDTYASRITVLDGSGDSFNPIMVLRVDSSIESANEVSTLINGTIAVVLVGDRPASGTLTVLFDDDAAMTSAREILARPASFQLVDPTRPVVNMTFVRSGTLTPGMHDEVRDVWEFQIGYQEVTP
jgi:hypothetical protein